MNAIKAGIVAGIIGFGILIVELFSLIFLAKAFPVSQIPFIVLTTGLLTFAITGALAGIFASRHVMSTKGALLPGLIAGAIVALAELLKMASLMFSIMGGPHGVDMLQAALPGVLLRAPITIALSGLCSALAVFFTRELYWSIPVLEQDRDPASLKNVYDELWKDATTIIVDMNRSIRVYLIAGILMLICGLVVLGMGLAGWQYLSPRGGSASDFVIVIGEIAGGLIQVVISPYLLYWYFKLRGRYSKLMLMEKSLGD